MLLFFNTADQRLFLYSILSLVALFFRGASFLLSFCLSPRVPLGVVLDAQPYVQTRASGCSP